MTMKRSLKRLRNAPEYAAQWVGASIRATPVVWDLLDRSGRETFRAHPPQLDEVQRGIVSRLETDGLAITHLDDLFPGEGLTAQLTQEIRALDGAQTGARKTFLRYALGENSVIDLANPLIRFSISPRMLHPVNAYLGTCARLRYFELAMTEVVDPATAAMGSQRWHRDPGMKRIIKAFLYLSDVDENCGPFTYIPRTQKTGALGHLFPQKQFGRGGRYPDAGAVEKAVNAADIKPCTGRAGTLILCDTTGLHRGGYSTSRPRIMYTSVYVPDPDTLTVKFAYPPRFEEQLTQLDPVSRFAISRVS